MAGHREYSEKDSFTISSASDELVVDRARREIRLTHKSLLGRETQRAIPLEQLTGLTLGFSQTPPMNLSAVADLLKKGWEASRRGETDLDRAVPQFDKGLWVRLDEPAAAVLRFPLEGIPEDIDFVELALQMAESGRFDYAGVFRMAGVETEVRLARRSEEGLGPAPHAADAVERREAARRMLARAEPPAFDPARFRCDHRVEEWAPGTRVAFRRGFSKWAFVVFPLILPLFAGPAIVSYGLATGRDLNLMNTVLLGGLGALFGLAMAALFASLLPRLVVFDWPSRTLVVRRWPRSETIPFQALIGIDAKGAYHDSSGESGGSTRTYRCDVSARVEDASGKPRKVELFETKLGTSPEEPLRETLPLARELARALGVDNHNQTYSFRSRSRKR